MLFFITAVFISPLIDMYGTRRPALCGMILFAVSLSLASIAPNVVALYFLFGILPGKHISF